MLHLPAFQMSHYVADAAQDVWHKRQKLLSESRKAIYLPYRLSVSNFSTDTDVNFYVHYVVTSDRWFYTLSDDAPFRMDNHDDLLFPDEGDDTDPSLRSQSWRHYAFKDCLQSGLEGRLRQKIAAIDAEDRVSLWDTLPLEDLNFSKSQHTRLQRSQYI